MLAADSAVATTNSNMNHELSSGRSAGRHIRLQPALALVRVSLGVEPRLESLHHATPMHRVHPKVVGNQVPPPSNVDAQVRSACILHLSVQGSTIWRGEVV
jgi:hypothetical protein